MSVVFDAQVKASYKLGEALKKPKKAPKAKKPAAKKAAPKKKAEGETVLFRNWGCGAGMQVVSVAAARRL